VSGLAHLAALGSLVVVAGCAAGAPPYARCGGDLGCAAGRCTELLYTRADGSEGGGTFCSDDCRQDGDCAALDGSVDAVCVTLDRGSPTRYFCAARCDEPSDCYAGLSCTATEDADLGSLCLP
jgi:hypothetical protein